MARRALVRGLSQSQHRQRAGGRRTAMRTELSLGRSVLLTQRVFSCLAINGFTENSRDTEVMNVVITGGAGFIGANLARRLLGRGESVTIFDNFSRRGSQENVEWLHAQRAARPEI